MAELCRQAHTSPVWSEGFARKELVAQRPVDDCRVKERNATVYGLMYYAYALLAVGRLRAVIVQAHAPESQCRHLHGGLTAAECAVFHAIFPHYGPVPARYGFSGRLHPVECRSEGQCSPDCSRPPDEIPAAYFDVLSHSSIFLMILAGLPAAIVMGGTSRVTTLCAPTMAPYPILTPGRTVELMPIHTRSSITMGRP